ncbi:MAG: glycosyltransferase [Ketobacter sp.]|nr:MAG: glycosyltransferase [Ketobacter sp.]
MMNSELRILFIVDAIQGRNGVGTYFQDLTCHLRNRVGQVELVAPSLHAPHPCQGVSLPMPGDATQQVFLPRMRRLTQLAVDMKPHVIVVPGPGLFALAGFWLASKLGIPVCMTHQTDYSKLVDLYWSGITGRFAQTMLAWTNLLMFRGSSTIATISQPQVQQLRRQGIPHPHLVGTTLAPEFVDPPVTEPRSQIRKVLFVGRLAAEKNLDHFLALTQQRPDLQFSIAGDGPLRGLVEEQLKCCNNLQFLGWCSRQTVQEQLDQHDLLILPSAVEAFGTVALEAMARKRLVLTTPACGINDWQSLAKGLITMEPGESLLQAVRRIETLPAAERSYICQQAHRGARQLNEEALDQWLSVLQITANKAHLLPRPIPSATFAVLRRLAAYQT